MQGQWHIKVWDDEIEQHVTLVSCCKAPVKIGESWEKGCDKGNGVGV